MPEAVQASAGLPVPGSKSEQAYALVKTRIVDGTYAPGHRLVLARIAGDLGVSVVPVREAIRRLEAEGLVTFERNVGATVAGIDPTEYLYTMQTLGIIEGAATALASPLIGPADLARARSVNDEMRACLQDFDPDRFTRLNQEFHSILFARCPNPHILDLVHRGWNRLASLRSSTFRFVPGRASASVEEHGELLRLIETQAPADEIEKATRRHRSATLDAYLAQSNAPDPLRNPQ
ncbi:GntR family transcriptional regulator [Arthrobacter sp. TMN-37]